MNQFDQNCLWSMVKKLKNNSRDVMINEWERMGKFLWAVQWHNLGKNYGAGRRGQIRALLRICGRFFLWTPDGLLAIWINRLWCKWILAIVIGKFVSICTNLAVAHVPEAFDRFCISGNVELFERIYVSGNVRPRMCMLAVIRVRIFNLGQNQDFDWRKM